MPSLGGWEIIIIVAVLLLLFGAKKLPDMARSVGQSARVFKGEMKGLKDDEGPKDAKDTKDEQPSSQQLSAGTTLNQPSQPAQQVQPAQPTQQTAPVTPQESTANGQAQPGRTDAT